MSRLAHRIAVAGLVLGLSGSGFAQAPAHTGPPQGAKRRARKSPKPSAAQPQPAVVQVPPQPVIPPSPEQLPPIAPQVTYQNGELTIVAQNSTLNAILAAVRARTGAQVEMPPETANDRVVVQIGPGSPRDVLAVLLQGSRFDYIVLGSENDPNALSRVILTRRQGGGATAVAGGGQPPAPPVAGGPPHGPAGPFRGGAARPEMNAEEEEPVAEVPEPQPVQPEQGAPAPGAMNPQQPGVYPGAPGPNVQPAPGGQYPQGAPGQTTPENQGQPGQVKTPEQLLQELQRMQQQQQQQQQQQRQPPQQQDE